MTTGITGVWGRWIAARLLTLARLVLLNGAPGVGKTSLARVGQWYRRPETRRLMPPPCPLHGGHQQGSLTVACAAKMALQRSSDASVSAEARSSMGKGSHR